mmetsp:Transcript_68840/g.165245  ORF Transcript_68840/g.165245 Transcript_68840/m.165245 type:complete len:119 (-) Transcript_68840:188-544(-)
MSSGQASGTQSTSGPKPGDIPVDPTSMDFRMQRLVRLRNAERALVMRVNAARRDRAENPSAYRQAGEECSIDNMHRGVSMLYKERFQMRDEYVAFVEMPPIDRVVQQELQQRRLEDPK